MTVVGRWPTLHFYLEWRLWKQRGPARKGGVLLCVVRTDSAIGLSAEFLAQSFGGVIEEQANLGREVTPCRVHDMNRRR